MKIVDAKTFIVGAAWHNPILWNPEWHKRSPQEVEK
jgi:hypothetical protein